MGPVAYKLYLRAFHHEGEILTVESGWMKGMKIRRHMRTFKPSYVTGRYESAIQDAMGKELKSARLFFDVGANIGIFTLLAMRVMPPGGRAVAFEPHPETAQDMRLQLQANDLTDRVTVVEAAAGDRCGSIEMDVDANSVMVRLATLSSATRKKTLRVKLTTIDEQARLLGELPDIMKVDVEGAEILTLKGADRVLGERKPVLFVEVHTPEIAEELYPLLEGYGYSFFELTGQPINDRRYVRFIKAKAQ